MTSGICAEILCVGTEILLGDIVNTNATFLSLRLAEIGIPMYRHTAVGDNPARLKTALREALDRVDLVIMSGGLGPTYDDLTKETVAEYFGKKMVLDESSLSAIESYFASTGRIMTENNKKQALIPEGALALTNKYGTAPGVAISEGGKTVIMLPGPPRELEPMYYDSVLPYLRGLSDRVIMSKFVHFFGIGESALESEIRELMESSKNPTAAPYAKDGEVRVRVTASAKSEKEASALCDEMIEKIKASSVAKYIYGVDVVSPEHALVAALKGKRLKIASAESCTGGYIAKRITDVSGASEVFSGAYVTYTNEVKINNLGVDRAIIEKYTEVSAECAAEMARQARIKTGADVGISTTGYAGPTGGTEKDPVGTVYIGVSTKNVEKAVRISLGNRKSRETVRYVAATNAIMNALSVINEEKM